MNALEPPRLVWPEAETAYVRHRWRPGCAGQSEERAALVATMLRRQSHRGPDDSGIWSGRTATLGICRLAILDLSAAGHQPMSEESQKVWVVENGEIYNFEELRTT